jgi:hypothetical protein
LYVPGPLESLGVSVGLTLSVRVLPSALGLLEALVRVSTCLGVPPFPGCWVPPVPAWLALAFFSFHLAHPDSFVFARWSLPTPEARCFRPSPSAGMLELLAHCSGVSELLIPGKGVLDVTSGRFRATGSSLPLAQTSTAGSQVA